MLKKIRYDLIERSNDLSELLAAVREDTEVPIVRGGQLLARVLPANQSKQRQAGLHRGACEISDDFDAPLPDSFWLGET